MAKTTKVFCGIMAVGFTAILLCCLPALARRGPWLLLAPVLAGLALLLWWGVGRLGDKACHRLAAALLPLWAVGLFCFAWAMRVEPTWDFGSNYEAANHLAEHGFFASPVIRNYYLVYIHNLFSMLVLAAWLMMTGPLGLSPLAACILLNVLALAAAVALLYLAVWRAWGAQKALFTGLMCAFFAPVILYSPIFYTDTLSMPFVSFCLLAAVCAERAKTLRGRLLWAGAAGLGAFVGYLTKGTVMLVAVAIVLCALLRHGKKALAYCGALAGTVALLLAVWQGVLASGLLIDTEDEALHKFPAQHWVMMGLSGSGGFNPEDEAYSASFPDLASRTEGDTARIAERLKDYGFGGLMAHLQRKVAFTWADGTYFAPGKLAQKPYEDTLLHRFLLLDAPYYNVLAGICAAAQLVLLLCLAGGAIAEGWLGAAKQPEPAAARRGLRAGSEATAAGRAWQGLFAKGPAAGEAAAPGLAMLALMAVFGLACFLLVWETRSRMLVNFSPLLVLVQAAMLMKLGDRAAARLKLPRRRP